MKNFRLLRADEIECRVQKCTEKGVSILLYKTARTDADLLDETVGPACWANDFKLVDGVLYGGIGVDFDKTGTMTWKWDAGIESNTEKEKGRASDAFKRAGFKHGIGRELYSAPFIWISASKCKISEKNGRYSCYDDFVISEITYDEQERIQSLEIQISGNPVYTYNRKNPVPLEAGPAKPPVTFVCADCGGNILPVKKRDGEMWLEPDMVKYSELRYGKRLCAACMKANEN